MFEVADHRLWIDGRIVDVRALIHRGQEAVAPELRTDNRLAGTEDDVAGQVLILGAETIRQPRPPARTDRLDVAGIHQEQRPLVGRRLVVHRPDNADVVDALRDFGKKFADFDPASSGLPEHKRGLHQFALLGRSLRRVLAVELLQFRLRIEGIDVRRPAVHEQEDDALDLGGKVPDLRRQRPRRDGRRFVRKHAGQAERAEPAAQAAEQLAAGKGEFG